MSPLPTFLLLLLAAAVAAQHPCPTTTTNTNTTNSTADLPFLLKAFKYVSGFHASLLPTAAACSSPITHLHLPSQNLTGAVSWHLLRQLPNLRSLDLSNNHLKGSIPHSFWSLPSLRRLNLSGNHLGGAVALDPSQPPSPIQLLSISNNRFTHSINLTGFSNLRSLDFSGNDLQTLPPGLAGLTRLTHLDISNCNISGTLKPISGLKSLIYLDASNNRLQGHFPAEFPPLTTLKFLNISNNNFTGRIISIKYPNFSPDSFNQSGISILPENSKTPPPPPPRVLHTKAAKPKFKHRISRVKETQKPSLWKKKTTRFIVELSFGVSAVVVLVFLSAFWCCRRRRSGRAKWSISKPIIQPSYKMERSGPFSFETESGSSWVADLREPGSAPVVMFEKPLMNLSFRDLIAATSAFGKESQLAEGRCGPVYRAVLPGDLHVAIKVLENLKGLDNVEAIGLFEELSRLRHPNLLPVSGYCIAGKEKLVLSEFMANGDLHGWLHGLPPGKPNIDDWSSDTWDYPDPNLTHSTTALSSPEVQTWARRHRIALGVARGLAYLHHARTNPVTHGHLVPANILLSDDLEPRIADFGLHRHASGGVGSVMDDVYSFGLVLMELLTGKPARTEEVLMWVRKHVKEGSSTRALDPRVRVNGESEKEMAECLRVGYLCTAEVAEKRPSMQQVVGMLKDVRS